MAVTYNGDGTYTIAIEIKIRAAAGGEARRRELQIIYDIQRLPFVDVIIDHNTLKEKA